jgi:hypothetical protein
VTAACPDENLRSEAVCSFIKQQRGHHNSCRASQNVERTFPKVRRRGSATIKQHAERKKALRHDRFSSELRRTPHSQASLRDVHGSSHDSP